MLKRIDSHPRRGGALLLALISVMMVAVLGAAYLQYSSAITKRQASAVDVKEAFYLAEAGLTEAYAGVTIGKTGNVGSEADPAAFGNGLFWVEATDLPDDMVQLEATGMAGIGRVELSAVVQRGEVSVASLGIFSNGPLTVLPGTVIDGYDSQEGAYEEFTSEELMALNGGRLGSNAAISLSGTPTSPTVVRGDVNAGPEDSVTQSGDVTVLGAIGSAYVNTELPPVEMPPIPIEDGLEPAAGAPVILAAGTQGLEYLHVQAGAEVTISGPATMLVGELSLESTGSLTFDTTQGAIQLYVTDGLRLDEGSRVATRGVDPTRLTLQVGPTEDPVQLLATGALHGALYAPEAEVEVGNGFEVHGALVGSQLTFTGNAALHFDQQILARTNESALPALVSWRILQLATAQGAQIGSDPFQILGLDRSLLRTAAGAHEDQLIDIDYIDAGGSLVSYSGWESAFDWNNVKDVVTMQRDGSTVPTFETPREPLGAGASANELAAQNAIASGMNSSALRDTLLGLLPLSNTVLSAAIQRAVPMNSSHLAEVLAACQPLAPSILDEVVTCSPLSASDMRDVLTGSSPLPSTVLVDAAASTVLGASEVRDLMVLNSPLDPTVLTALANRLPALPLAELTAILLAQ